VQIFE
jgi:hypothetical protein